MKKTNLIILLVFPFLISLFCIITVNTTYNRVDVDISYIDWEYNDMEGFQLSDTGYRLEAVGVNQRYYRVSGGNALIWKVENKDTSNPDPCAEIYQTGGSYYLRPLREGEVVITCSNQKGNVHRQMTGIIYKDAAILFYPTVGASQTNIDSTVYYGEYDHAVGTPAVVDMTMLVVPSSAASELSAVTSENVSFDPATGQIRILAPGEAKVTLNLASGLAAPVSFDFRVVDEGVNVYTYEDLLACTNRSESGEIVVLRKSFESLQNAYVTDTAGDPIKSGEGFRLKSNNVALFGEYDAATKRFSFGDEVVRLTTTYNRNFIDQWNAFAAENPSYAPITDQIVVGLHVKKDFYGNGYTLNLHNLTYPYSYTLMNTENGETVRIPQLRQDNLFRGPLKMYTLGDPNNVPLVSLYGQDNVGMYVDGDGITVNDVNLKNCDFGDRLANLATAGTVMEIAGDGVTVRNSRISNGKNVLRSFSSMNLTLSNCLISNAETFLFVTGSNDYVPVNTEAMASFYALDGKQKTEVLSAFIAPKGEGDQIFNQFLTKYCTTPEEKANMRRALLAVQDAINATREIEGKYRGSTEITDCFFYRSGVSAICMESLFNSPFLETASPSIITEAFSIFAEMGKTLVPYTATHVSGVSYPVRVNISGDTRFYDYKEVNSIDLTGLLEENISAVAASLVSGADIDLDTVFPLRSLVVQKAGNLGATYRDRETGRTYVNSPVAYYGGGVNLSQVTVDGYEHRGKISGDVDVDLLDTYLNLSGSSQTDTLRGLVLKTVITVTGFEPFSFRFTTDGYLFGETPKVTDLIANAKGV